MPEETPNVTPIAPIGRDIGRDIASGKEAEHHLDAFISKRDKQRRRDEGARRAREAWQATEILHDQQRREANRRAWASYHRQQAERHRATLTDLIQYHQDQAEK